MTRLKTVEPWLRVAAAVAVAVAALVLLGSFGRHGREYYTALRWIVCAASVLLLWRGVAAGLVWPWGLLAVALLFNPLAPIHLYRDAWKLIDLATAAVLAAACAAMEIKTRKAGGEDGR